MGVGSHDSDEVFPHLSHTCPILSVWTHGSRKSIIAAPGESTGISTLICRWGREMDKRAHKIITKASEKPETNSVARLTA